MSDQKFIIRLHNVHRATGMTVYRVAKLTGMNPNTVGKYVGDGDVITGRLEGAVVQLAKFYGVDWRDPAIIEVIEAEA